MKSSEETKKTIWTEDYRITSFLVNLRGHAGLYAMLNLVQDVGWQHAEHLQIRLPRHLGWVFTRQKLLMQKWPSWNQTVTLKTWLRPPQRDLFLYRDYEVFLGSEKIGECTSSFTVMDMQTRRLASQDWSQFPALWNEGTSLHHRPGKIPPQSSESLENLSVFEVRNSDIDLNRHVNNTRYAQWVLDSIPIDILRDGDELYEYDVNFMAETKIGDQVVVQAVHDSGENPQRGQIHFQGQRKSDLKSVFTARMKTRPRVT